MAVLKGFLKVIKCDLPGPKRGGHNNKVAVNERGGRKAGSIHCINLSV